jgi:hypothetical protein
MPRSAFARIARPIKDLSVTVDVVTVDIDMMMPLPGSSIASSTPMEAIFFPSGTFQAAKWHPKSVLSRFEILVHQSSRMTLEFVDRATENSNRDTLANSIRCVVTGLRLWSAACRRDGTHLLQIFRAAGSRAPVAQLDRALDSESKGHRFESCRVRHSGTNVRTPGVALVPAITHCSRTSLRPNRRTTTSSTSIRSTMDVSHALRAGVSPS